MEVIFNFCFVFVFVFQHSTASAVVTGVSVVSQASRCRVISLYACISYRISPTYSHRKDDSDLNRMVSPPSRLVASL